MINYQREEVFSAKLLEVSKEYDGDCWICKDKIERYMIEIEVDDDVVTDDLSLCVFCGINYVKQFKKKYENEIKDYQLKIEDHQLKIDNAKNCLKYYEDIINKTKGIKRTNRKILCRTCARRDNNNKYCHIANDDYVKVQCSEYKLSKKFTDPEKQCPFCGKYTMPKSFQEKGDLSYIVCSNCHNYIYEYIEENE